LGKLRKFMDRDLIFPLCHIDPFPILSATGILSKALQKK
jgi:hypothetical protein